MSKSSHDPIHADAATAGSLSACSLPARSAAMVAVNGSELFAEGTLMKELSGLGFGTRVETIAS
jgi:hypothetical protein